MSLLPRAAFRASRVLQASASSTSPTATTQSDAARAHEESKAHQDGKEELRKGAKRDPELFVLGGVVTFALGFSGWYFGAKPTTASSEQAVSAIAGSEPWHSGTKGKYQYHSKTSKGVPKDAPSALHSVTIPDVTLPKKLHDTFNKYDKEEFDDY